jgi:hypothetical protein
MTRKRFSEEYILNILRQIEQDLAGGKTDEAAIRTAGVVAAKPPNQDAPVQWSVKLHHVWNHRWNLFAQDGFLASYLRKKTSMILGAIQIAGFICLNL